MFRKKRESSICYNYSLLGYETVEFTRHALDRLRERGIKRQHVFDAINYPDKTGLKGHRIGRKRIQKANVNGDIILDVTYEELEDRLRVVTAWIEDRREHRSKSKQKKKRSPKRSKRGRKRK